MHEPTIAIVLHVLGGGLPRVLYHCLGSAIRYEYPLEFELMEESAPKRRKIEEIPSEPNGGSPEAQQSTSDQVTKRNIFGETCNICQLQPGKYRYAAFLPPRAGLHFGLGSLRFQLPWL